MPIIVAVGLRRCTLPFRRSHTGALWAEVTRPLTRGVIVDCKERVAKCSLAVTFHNMRLTRCSRRARSGARCCSGCEGKPADSPSAARLNAFTGNVRKHEFRVVRAQVEKIIIITAHGAGSMTAPRTQKSSDSAASREEAWLALPRHSISRASRARLLVDRQSLRPDGCFQALFRPGLQWKPTAVASPEYGPSESRGPKTIRPVMRPPGPITVQTLRMKRLQPGLFCSVFASGGNSHG